MRCEGEQAGHGIENIHGAPVYRLRGNLLPLVYLNRELQLARRIRSRGSINIVVLQADDRQFGLVVDEINDTEEIVVKPLGKQLKTVSCFAGATIMGDGHVALILDVLGLAQMTRVVSDLREQNVAKQGLKAARERRPARVLAAVPHRQGRSHGDPALPGVAAGGVSRHPGGALRRPRGHSVSRADHAAGQAGARPWVMPAPATANCCRSSCTPATGAASAWWWTRSWTSPISRRRCSKSARWKRCKGAAVIQQRVTDLLDVPALLAAQQLAGGEGAQA